jgi:Flp pilus assembly protein TadG
MHLRGSRGSRERGVVLAWFGLLLFVGMGMAAVVNDLSYLYVSQGELQDAADAAALAAVAELKRGGSRADAVRAAQIVAERNRAAGDHVRLAASDVDFGSYDSGSDTFDSGGFGNASAIRVTARRTRGAPGGPVGLLFAGVLGQHTADVAAEAVAAMRKRDIVIVQDVTYSFLQEIEDAKHADTMLVNAVARQALAGDRMGLVTFNEAASEDLGLTPVPDQTSTVLSAIRRVTACPSPQVRNCGGTHIAPGFNAGARLFDGDSVDAEKVLILVSDGMPYPSGRRQPAIVAADRAGDAGVNIFTVTLTQESGGAYGSGGADAAFNAGLVRGYGKAYHTPDAKQLDDLLLKILEEMPVRLVQ